ncbi:MAG: iron-siderophore ABC transporter substrate-binding protein [Cyanobacteria bacterium P01_G01_bin.19]
MACDWAQPTLRDRSIADSESCRLVKHEVGETEVCGQPQKVVALSPHILDSILALGVQPAGFAQSVEPGIKTYNNPAEQIPYLGQWVTTQPISVGDRDSPSLESLTLLQPDLIVGEKWYNRDEYPLLSQIAPTLLFSDQSDDGQQSWHYSIEGIAEAVGKPVQAEALLAAHDEQIAQARTALQPVLQAHPRVLSLYSNLNNSVGLASNYTTSRLLKEIGFEMVEPEGIESGAEISWEIVPQMETDLMMIFYWSDEDFLNPEDPMQQQWAQKPLLESLPVFQQGRVFFVDYYLWGSHTRGPLTDKLILEALPDLLLGSVEGADSK